MLAYNDARDDDNLVYYMLLINCAMIHYAHFAEQIDYCEEALGSTARFAASADVKVSLTPSEEVAKVFLNIIQRCTQRNYKRRCVMDEVCVHAASHVYNSSCDVFV